MKFLIDECLTPELVVMAVAHGRFESTCVRNRGWSGSKDHVLVRHAVAEDFTIVTCNSVDFRGKGLGAIGGEHSKQEVHPGLICLNSESPLDLDLQRELFEIALDVLATEKEDLVNRALDLFHRTDGSIVVEIDDLAASAGGVEKSSQ